MAKSGKRHVGSQTYGRQIIKDQQVIFWDKYRITKRDFIVTFDFQNPEYGMRYYYMKEELSLKGNVRLLRVFTKMFTSTVKYKL